MSDLAYQQLSSRNSVHWSAMDDFDKVVKKYEEDGFQFQTRSLDWGKRLIGTRKGGGKSSTGLGGLLDKALGSTQRMMIGHFDHGNPTPPEFQLFLKEAEKFFDEFHDGSKITTIVVVTPSKLDKRPLSYLIDHSDDRVVELLEYKSLGATQRVEPTKPTTGLQPVSPPAVTSTTLDYLAISRALPSPVARERILYAWEVYPEKPLGEGQSVFALTQERGLLMRKVGSDIVCDHQFKWEATAEPQVEIDAGGPMLRLYDGTRENRLRNRDAAFIQALIHHVKWVRAGVISGFMVELGFDKELVERCGSDFAAGRFVDAVRNAYTLLESRIRKETLLPASIVGEKLAVEAFKPEGGRIPVGSSSSEQQGVLLLFQGAFLAFRNPVAHHQEVSGLDRSRAFEQLALVNLLLELVARGKEQFQKGLA